MKNQRNSSNYRISANKNKKKVVLISILAAVLILFVALGALYFVFPTLKSNFVESQKTPYEKGVLGDWYYHCKISGYGTSDVRHTDVAREDEIWTFNENGKAIRQQGDEVIEGDYTIKDNMIEVSFDEQRIYTAEIIFEGDAMLFISKDDGWASFHFNKTSHKEENVTGVYTYSLTNSIWNSSNSVLKEGYIQGYTVHLDFEKTTPLPENDTLDIGNSILYKKLSDTESVQTTVLYNKSSVHLNPDRKSGYVEINLPGRIAKGEYFYETSVCTRENGGPIIGDNDDIRIDFKVE